MADIVGSGKATAPLAAAVLATIAAPAPGTYKIHVSAAVSNQAAADSDNVKLVINNADLANPLPCGVTGVPVNSDFVETLDGTHAVSVIVLANATSAIVYEATIELTLMSEDNNEVDAELL